MIKRPKAKIERIFGRTFVLFTQQQMGLLFNHPTKIFFKHNRSPSIASHTRVVSLIAMGWCEPAPSPLIVRTMPTSAARVFPRGVISFTCAARGLGYQCCSWDHRSRSRGRVVSRKRRTYLLHYAANNNAESDAAGAAP